MTEERVGLDRWVAWLPVERAVDWDALYEDALPRVYNFFRYRLGDEADAEDLTSLTFEKAWRARHRYRRDRAGFATWLLAIAKNVAIDHHRRRRAHEPLGRRLVREVLLELKRAGTAVFLNSHLLGEVEVTCDRVAFVKAGRVVRELALGELGTGLEVELRMGGLDAATLAGLARHGDGLTREGDRVRLRVADEESLPAIARYLASTPARLYEMRPALRSLEAIFLETMGDDQRPG